MLDSVLHCAALLLVEDDSDRLIRCLFDLHLHGSKLGIDAWGTFRACYHQACWYLACSLHDNLLRSRLCPFSFLCLQSSLKVSWRLVKKILQLFIDVPIVLCYGEVDHLLIVAVKSFYYLKSLIRKIMTVLFQILGWLIHNTLCLLVLVNVVILYGKIVVELWEHIPVLLLELSLSFIIVTINALLLFWLFSMPFDFFSIITVISSIGYLRFVVFTFFRVLGRCSIQ